MYCIQLRMTKHPSRKVMNFRHLLGCNCHTIEAMKIVHHHANGRFDGLISEHQSVNPSRESISILSGKYKRFTFIHSVVY